MILGWPWWVAAALAAGLVVALHLWSSRPPTALVLPTARFMPRASSARRTRSALDDVLLLLVRVATVVAACATLAGLRLARLREGVARVLVVDASRAVGDTSAREVAVRAAREGAAEVVTVAFDTTARVLSPGEPIAGTRAPGDLAVAMIRAAREVPRLRARFARVEVVLVTPLVAEAWSPALGSLSAAVGVPVVVRRLAPPTSDAVPVPGTPALPDPRDAPGAAAWSALGGLRAGLRVVDGSATADDTAFARRGGVVVSWRGGSDTAATVRGVATGNAVAIGRWITGTPAAGTPIAWLDDGTVVATETPAGGGCLRSVALGWPAAGDEPLRQAQGRLVRALSAPCGGTPALTPIPDAIARSLAVSAPPARATIANPTSRRFFVVLALLGLGAEWWLRRSRRERRV